MNFLSRWFRRLPKAPSWIAPEALARRLGRESALLIIDVRSPDEFTGPLGHIREATNMPLNELPAQQLQEAGMSDVSVLRGGMEQWRVLGLPAR